MMIVGIRPALMDTVLPIDKLSGGTWPKRGSYTEKLSFCKDCAMMAKSTRQPHSRKPRFDIGKFSSESNNVSRCLFCVLSTSVFVVVGNL